MPTLPKRHGKPWTDADEAELQKRIAADPDDWDSTEAEVAQAKPFAEAFPDLADSIRKRRGRPPSDNPKLALKLRIDRDIVEKFKATGDGWQTRMNDALRRAASRL
jgi:uncharacterized protein (DUF4415 family)